MKNNVPDHSQTFHRHVQSSVMDAVHRSNAEWLKFYVLSDEVRWALASQQPVVALESTVLTHGLPWPTNRTVAHLLESVVRQHHATPATIAVIEGRIRVGLSAVELDRLCDWARQPESARHLHKLTTRDLPWALALGKSGGTTVAATAFVAHQFGIRVFATGGIGGVHRDGHITMDVSADLIELSRTPVCVVCAGAKSILDIGRTLEYLETHGVTVVGWNTEEFPAFFVASSGHRVPYTIRTAQEGARLLYTLHTLGQRSGVILGVPIPAIHAADGHRIELAIQHALRDAQHNGITGNALTPYLLAAVNRLTSGASLRANVALLANNAAVAAQIACALNALQTTPPDVCVVGALALDVTSRVEEGTTLRAGVSNVGRVTLSSGGVGRNIAEALARLDGGTQRMRTLLLSVSLAPTRDPLAAYLFEQLRRAGCDTSGIVLLDNAPSQLSTPVFHCVLAENGEVGVAVNAMELCNRITPTLLHRFVSVLQHAHYVVVDANLPQDTLVWLANFVHRAGGTLWFEPTSSVKCIRAVPILDKLTYISPNVDELWALTQAVAPHHALSHDDVAQNASILLGRGVRNVIVKMGAHGVSWFTKDAGSGHLDALPVRAVVSAAGAGDCLVAGTLFALHNGLCLADALTFGLHVARASVESSVTVPPTIQPSLFAHFMAQITQ
jgi:pseudouridine-5'-phosphate glycosidase/pseudouridine kinase